MLTQAAAIVAGGAVGLGWGWVGTRVFRSSIVQDASATLVGWFLGTIVGVAMPLAFVLASSTSGGLGAASAGASETLLLFPIAGALLVVGAQWLRRRVSRAAVVSIGLGGLTGAFGAFLAAASIHWSS